MSLSNRQWLVVILLLLPIILGFARRKKLLAEGTVKLLVLFLIGSLIAVYPRFSFFHFQLAIALISIILGYTLDKTKKYFPVLLAVSYLLLVPLVHRPVFRAEWRQEARFYSQADLDFSKVLEGEVGEEDSVFLLGFPSSLYVFANRLPPKPWTDNFGWYLEIPEVQKSIINRWETNPPSVITWNEPKEGNWYDLGVYQPKEIRSWIVSNYNKGEELKKGVWLWQRKN